MKLQLRPSTLQPMSYLDFMVAETNIVDCSVNLSFRFTKQSERQAVIHLYREKKDYSLSYDIMIT